MSTANDAIVATLNPTAASVARALLAAKPDSILTSGCRLVDGQCAAMASNIAPNHLDWIARTYKDTPVEEACQAWVTANPELAAVVASCETGLLGVLASFPPEQLRQLSWHLPTSAAGLADAFDVKPDGDQSKILTIKNLIATATAAGATGKLLTEEGGLVRWHVQVA